MRTLAELEALDGYMTPEGGKYLAEIASTVPANRAIVEIGVFKGKSLAYIAEGNADSPIYGIDPWDMPGGRARAAHVKVAANYWQAKEVVGVYPNVTLIRDFGANQGRQWTRPLIGMLHIDGKHTLAAVTEDFGAFEPVLAPGATVVFDDYGHKKYPGVAMAVRKIAARRGVEFKLEAGRFGVIQL